MEIDDLPKDKKIILFDGVCNLCNASVQFILKRDKMDRFRFVALQSVLGQKIINHIGIDTKKADSLILYEPGKAYYSKASAVLKITKELGGFYNLMSVLTVLPKAIQNYIYDYIAKNRYRWYGKKDTCMFPTPELESKFLQ